MTPHSRALAIRAQLRDLHELAIRTNDAAEFEGAVSAIALLNGVLPEVDAQVRRERRVRCG